MSAAYDQKKIDALASELMEPQRLAGGGAIRKAAEAVRQAADNDLDMSTEARMQRAAEQGFNVDMPVYHGTGEDFLEFDPLKIGKTDEGWFGQGFYFSPIPDIANQYAAGRSPNVQQVYLRAKNPYDWRKNEGASLRLGTAEERYAKTKEILEKGYDAVDVYSDRIKIGQDEILPDNVFLAIVQRAQRLGDPVMPRAMIEQALKSGMDYHDFARRYGNDIASMMPVKKTLMEQVVFDPANIRSVNAAFDPAKRESSNILSGLGAGAVGLGALTSEDDPEGMSKGGLVDKLRSAASSVKEAGNVYEAAVGNMFSPFEPTEPQLGDPNDWEFPELRLRRPGIVNLAIGMPNMFADMRDLFGAVKDVAIGDEVPDEQWPRWDKATEAQGRYEEDMDTFLRHYTGKSVDELSGPMSAVLGLSEAAVQPGIIKANIIEKLPRLARYLSHLAEFATPVTVASPGAMMTGAGFNAGIRVLPALTDGDDLEQMNARYSGRELSGEDQARLDNYLQELLGKKDGGLIDRINQGFYENISKPAVGTAIDMTLGLGDLAQMAARYLGNKAGFDAGEFTSVAQPVKEAIGVDDYNPYTIGGVGASILPFAAAGRTAQAINAAPAGVRQLQAALPNLGRESAAYVGAEAAGAGAREFMPDSPMAEVLASVAGGMGGSALGSQPTSMGIIKDKGGNWLKGAIEDELGLLHSTNQGMRADTPARQLAEMEARFTPESIATLPQHTREFVQQNIDQLRSRAQIDNWIDSKLNKYIRNDMATESDPIRLHAESFQAEKADKLARKDEQIARAMDNLERTRLERGVTANDLTRSQAQIRELQRERALIAAQTGLHVNPDEVGINRYLAEDIREGQGYPQLGASRTAQAWEDASDVAVFPSTAGTHLTYSADSVLDDNPWLAKIPPESKTYEMRQVGFAHNFRGLGFDHMMDELRNATAPNSDLPENLRIDPSNLSNMSVPEIVKKIDEINAWRNVNRSEVDAARANNAATVPFKEYDAVPYRGEPNTEGLKWVQLARTEDTPEADAALNDALEYEGNIMNHSVGGYRTPDRGGSQDYGLGGWDAITSGRARVYSLRDANGNPHATIEVLSSPVRYNDIVREIGVKAASDMSNRGMTVAQMAQAIPNFKMPARITQIKGLNNKIPEEQYLPFVQDFVLSQDWSDIGDFHHTGLTRLYSDSDLAKAMRDAGQTPPYYLTQEQLSELRKQYPTGYAQGGLVYDADAINALANELMEPVRLAGGGAIRKAAEAIGAAQTLPPLENAQKTQLGSSTIPSYAKAREILSGKKRILDFGAGRGQGASLIGADTFEPYPREGFSPSYNSVTDIPSGSYDGLTSLNVLNVMPREVRDDAVRNIGRVLMDGGEAVITTRGRDVMTANGVDGPEPMSRITTADTYQKGFTQQELIDYVSNVLGEGYVVSSLPQKVGAAGVLVKKVGRNSENATDASLEGLAEGGPPRSRLRRAAAAIRGATGSNPVQTEAGSDSLEDLYDHYVSLGYPEGTARKIASGDLPMDTASRMQRAAELGYTEPMYVGTSSGADIREFNPDIGTGARQRTGTWGSADKLNANTYASLPRGQMYQLLMKPSEQAEINAGGRNWSMLPSDSAMTLNDGVKVNLSEAGYTRRNTNDLARLARIYGADSLRVNNVRDMGPYGLFEEDVPEFSDTMVVFKPELLRSKLSAAFDPDEIKNRNILAGGSGIGLGLGALLASGEEEREEFAEGGPPRSRIRRAAEAVQAIDSASTANIPARPSAQSAASPESFSLYHGTPHVFGPSQRVVNTQTGKEYVSDPDMVRTILSKDPDTYEVIGDNPLGMFDINRIGTGEGAQAYGFGAYGTQLPDVGRGYRQTLLRRHNIPDIPTIAGKPIEDVYSQIERRAGRLPVEQARPEYDKLSIIEQMMIDGDILGIRQGRDDFDPEAMKWFEQEIAPKYERPGALYEMQVNAPQRMFLDWDMPIIDQTPEVQASLRDAGIYDPDVERTIDLLLNEKQMISLDRDPVTNAMRDERKWHDISRQIEEMRRRQPANMTGRQAYYLSAPDARSQAEASEALKRAGIPGIQYLDQGSRGDGEGTRNFVIFDPKMIEILEKYGVAGATTGAGAMAMSGEEEPQEFNGGGRIRRAAAAIREAQGSTPSTLPSNQYIIRPGDIGYDKRVDDRKREQDRIANSIFQYERTADINPPEYSIFDLEGRPFILGMADRTEAASNLLGIEGVDFDIPVRLQGGQNYMFNNPGQVWAADKGAVSAVMNVAKGMDENPLFLPFSMAPTSGDHATMTTDAMLSYARNNMNKREIAKANKLLRSWMPEFKGIDNPDSMRQLGAASGATRKAFQGIMDTEFRNAGGIGIGQARLSVTDPSQYSIPDIMLMNVGEIDRNAPRFKVSGHDTYAQGIPGGGLGRLKEQNVSALHLLPDFVAQRGVNIQNPHSEDTYTLRRGVRSGVITDHVLRNIERMLIDRDRGYADGGEVDAYAGNQRENEYAKMIADNIWDTSKRLGITTQEAMNAVIGTQQQTIGGLGRYSQHIKSK